MAVQNDRSVTGAKGTTGVTRLQLKPEVLAAAQEARNGLKDTVAVLTKSLAVPNNGLDANQKKEVKAALVDLKQALAVLKSVPPGGVSPDLTVGGRPRPPNNGPVALYGVFFMSTVNKLVLTTTKLRDTLESHQPGLRLSADERHARSVIRGEISQAMAKLVNARDGVTTTP